MGVVALQSRGDTVLSLIHTKFPNYHPLLAMAEMAHDTNVEDSVKFNCHKELARYVAPQLKAVEVRTSSDELPRVSVSLFAEAESIEDATIVE